MAFPIPDTPKNVRRALNSRAIVSESRRDRTFQEGGAVAVSPTIVFQALTQSGTWEEHSENGFIQ